MVPNSNMSLTLSLSFLMVTQDKKEKHDGIDIGSEIPIRLDG